MTVKNWKIILAKYKKVWSAVPAILFMVVIYWFSSRTAVQSQGSSNKVVDVVVAVGESCFGKIKDNRDQVYEILSTIVRKGAHFTEYAVLCVLLLYWLSSFSISYRRRCAIAVAISALYAATDEFHQLFVPGRSGQITDVMIDTSGALVGMLVVSAARIIVLHYRKPRTVY